MNAEPEPVVAGTYYGELSPGGQWFWNGTGTADDHWIANPVAPVVEPLGSTTITRVQVLTWPRHDCRTKGTGSIPDWQFQTWALHDIIRVNGL